jgi:hypothetical protein
MTRYCVTIPANQGFNNSNQPVEFWTGNEAAASQLTIQFRKQGIQATLQQSILETVDVEQLA